MIPFYKDLDSVLESNKSKVAIFDTEKNVLTYNQLKIEINKNLIWLNSLNVKSGDYIICLIPNSMETAILFLACMYAGVYFAPLHHQSTASEIYRLQDLLKAKFCFHSDKHDKNKISNLSNINFELINYEKSILSSMKLSTEPIKKSIGGRLIVSSSGSTGKPKAILIDINRLWSASIAFSEFYGLSRNNITFWNYLPMSYIGGLFNLLLIPLASKSSVLIDESYNTKTLLKYWSIVEEHNINCIWLVPTIMRSLIDMEKRSKSFKNKDIKLRYCFLGTSPSSEEEKNNFKKFFNVSPLENFGLSETTFISCAIEDKKNKAINSSVGSLMPNIEVKIKNDKGKIGELWVKTPYIMFGYYINDHEINLPLDKDGYYNTGDIGYIQNNELFLTGRSRDIIKKGGLIIYLREIELMVEKQSYIKQAVAVKKEHSFYGESYDLYCSIEDTNVDVKKILKKLSNWYEINLMKYKWPDGTHICREFPLTSSGKIQKHLISSSHIINNE